MKRFTGSSHWSRTWTSTFLATAAAQTAKHSMAARSAGVWVASASAATNSASTPGRTFTGNGGTLVTPKGSIVSHFSGFGTAVRCAEGWNSGLL